MESMVWQFMAPAEPPRLTLVGPSRRTREIRSGLTRERLIAMLQGFMFSLVGFHVSPPGVTCFPSKGFMFSLFVINQPNGHVSVEAKAKEGHAAVSKDWS